MLRVQWTRRLVSGRSSAERAPGGSEATAAQEAWGWEDSDAGRAETETRHSRMSFRIGEEQQQRERRGLFGGAGERRVRWSDGAWREPAGREAASATRAQRPGPLDASTLASTTRQNTTPHHHAPTDNINSVVRCAGRGAACLL